MNKEKMKELEYFRDMLENLSCDEYINELKQRVLESEDVTEDDLNGFEIGIVATICDIKNIIEYRILQNAEIDQKYPM